MLDSLVSAWTQSLRLGPGPWLSGTELYSATLWGAPQRDSAGFLIGVLATAELAALGPVALVPVAPFTESMDVPGGKRAASNSTSMESTWPSRAWALEIRFRARVALSSTGSAGTLLMTAARPAQLTALESLTAGRAWVRLARVFLVTGGVLVGGG